MTKPKGKDEIREFDELAVWQKSHSLLLSLYDDVNTFPEGERFVLRSQLLRAAGSISANIAEGFGRFSYQENIRFLQIARGSLAETRNHLLVARDLGYLPDSRYNQLAKEIKTIGILINGTIKSTKQQLKKV